MGPGTAQPAPRGRGPWRSRGVLRHGVVLAAAGHGWAVPRKEKRSSWDQLQWAGPGDRLVRGKAHGGPNPGPGSRPGRRRPLVPGPSGAKPPALPRRRRLLWDGNVKEPLSHRVTDQRRIKPKVTAGGQKVVPSSLSRRGNSPFLRWGQPSTSSVAGASELHVSDGDVPGHVLLIFAPCVSSWQFQLLKAKVERSYL